MTAAVDTFRAAPVTPLRQRLVDAAIHLTTTSGWAAVTMARLADLTGVSRQTVYNEVGGKPALAQAVVESELARFLAVMTAAFEAQPRDTVAAVRAAVHDVLDLAASSPLIQSVASMSHGVDSDLLPLLTVRSGDLLARAAAAVDALVAPRRPQLPDARRAAVVDVVVRSVLSHVMQPAGSVAESADAIAWVAGSALGPEPRRRTGPAS